MGKTKNNKRKEKKDKIPDLKKDKICSIQFYFNIRNMIFPVQIFINFNVKIFNKIIYNR